MLSVNNTRGWLSIVLATFLSTVVSAEVTKLENEAIRVELSNTSGGFDCCQRPVGIGGDGAVIVRRDQAPLAVG